jgi:hypothetical protein
VLQLEPLNVLGILNDLLYRITTIVLANQAGKEKELSASLARKDQGHNRQSRARVFSFLHNVTVYYHLRSPWLPLPHTQKALQRQFSEPEAADLNRIIFPQPSPLCGGD